METNGGRRILRTPRGRSREWFFVLSQQQQQ